MTALRFQTLVDQDHVTRAFNVDHVVAITLTDAGRQSRQPLVSVVLTTGDIVPGLRIPVPAELRDPANVNESWKDQLLSRAIADFFEALP